MPQTNLRKSLNTRLRAPIKAAVQALNDSLLGRAGLRLVRVGRPTRNFAEFFRHVKQLGFNPRTVVDVGVAFGTNDIYAAFPQSKFYLIEPIEEFAPFITVLQTRYAIEYFKVAAGAASGRIALNIHPDPCRTSALRRASVEQRTVTVVTLDELLLNKSCESPVLLKIDTEGAEIRTVKAIEERFLRRIRTIYFETHPDEILHGTFFEQALLPNDVCQLTNKGHIETTRS